MYYSLPFGEITSESCSRARVVHGPLSNRALKALTQSFQIFSTFSVVDPTQPTKN